MEIAARSNNGEAGTIPEAHPMKNFLIATFDALLDMSPETIIAGVVMALLLTLPIAGVYAALRRVGKEPAMILMALAIVANVLGMVVASGYARSALTGRINRGSIRSGMPRDGGPPFGAPHWPEGGRGEGPRSTMMASLIFEDADVNRDGSLSADEAAAAASEFVKSVAGQDRDSIDSATLGESLRLRLRHQRADPGRPAEGLSPGKAPIPAP